MKGEVASLYNIASSRVNILWLLPQDWVTSQAVSSSSSCHLTCSDSSGLHLNPTLLKTILNSPLSSGLLSSSCLENHPQSDALPLSVVWSSQKESLRESSFCYSCESDIPLSWLSRTGDPLIHHGRHFGRTVHAMCNVQVLIINGLLHLSEADGEVQEETLTYEFVLWPVLLSSIFTRILPSAGLERSIECFKSSCRWYQAS